MGRHKGFKHSEETREKMRQAKLGKFGEAANAYKNGIGIYRRSKPEERVCFLRDNKDCNGRIERHHLDGDRRNNESENLRWACTHHHTIIDPKKASGRKKKIDKLIEAEIQRTMEVFN